MSRPAGALDILVIEDDPPSAELALYLLRSAGYRPRVAGDGRTGLRFALEEPPDLILCDLQLPGLSGYEVLGELLRSAPAERAPVIAMTASSIPIERDRILGAGFDGCIVKPIDPTCFIAQIESFLPPRNQYSPP